LAISRAGRLDSRIVAATVLLLIGMIVPGI
jgi:hypothetical protein